MVARGAGSLQATNILQSFAMAGGHGCLRTYSKGNHLHFCIPLNLTRGSSINQKEQFYLIYLLQLQIKFFVLLVSH